MLMITQLNQRTKRISSDKNLFFVCW